MGFGTGRTGHAGRAWEGCGDADRWCIGLVLPSPAKPRGQQSLQGAESQRSCLAGSRWQLCLALAVGTGAEARHGPLGQRRTSQQGAGGHHPTGSAPSQRGHPHGRGCRGPGGGRGERQRRLLACCAPGSGISQDTDAGKWGTSRDPRRRGALGSCAARRTGVPRMGAPTEEQSPWNRECPRGKRDHGSPRVSSPWKEAARGKGRDKAVPHRNGVRGKGLLSEEGAHDPGTGAPEFSG